MRSYQPGMGRGMRRRAANRITPRMGKPTVGIVSANRKVMEHMETIAVVTE